MKTVLGVERADKVLDFCVDLTQDEFEQYLRANVALNGFFNDAQLFGIAILNYQEYYDALHTHLQAFILRQREHFDSRHSHLDINRCLLNWLASVRTFLDHAESRIKGRYGSESQNWRNLKESCSNEYDNNFSYRFLYKVRNYAQHCGFPIHEIKFSSAASESDPEEPIHTLGVICIRDRLLSEFDGWGRQLKEEISGLPSIIDINPHVDAMMRSLESINSNHAREEFSMLRESALFITSLFQQVPPGRGEPGMFEIKVIEDETGKVTGISQMVAHGTPTGLVNAVLSGRIEDVMGQIIVETI